MTDLTDRPFVLCMGAQRGGTTWLHTQLDAHPQTAFLPVKELRYFDYLHYFDFQKRRDQRTASFHRKYPEGWTPSRPAAERRREWYRHFSLVERKDFDDAWYAALFDGLPKDRLTGDFSPDYSLLPPEGLRHLASVVPHARVIFMARNPVERVISGAAYSVRRDAPPDDAAFEKQLRRILGRKLQHEFSAYRHILEGILSVYPEDRVGVFFHDEISRDPEGLLRDVCTFLDIAPPGETYAPGFEREINRTRSYKVPDALRADLYVRYMPDIRWMAERFGGAALDWQARAEAMAAETGAG